jgi:Protein of unknown function (DUF4231)
MDEITTYLEKDFAEAVRFYDQGAKKAKRSFRLFSLYVILVSAGLTLVVTLGPQGDGWRVLAGVLSASISVATACLAQFKYQDNWLCYRGTWDALKRELRLFKAGAGDYKNAANKNSRFVERVEAIQSKETAEFYARHTQGEQRMQHSEGHN